MPNQQCEQCRHPDHQTGVTIAMCDASVRFITNYIDAGDPSVTPPVTALGASKWGVWGALGTAKGGESVAQIVD